MIKLNEEFQTKPATIVKNLKRHMENWPEEDSKILESVVASIVAGTTIFDVEKETIDYTNKYKKETIKESLQNYILTKLKNGINGIPLVFIFDLEEFNSFGYFDFVETFDEADIELVNKEMKSYFEELFEFDQNSYSLTTTVEAINDPMDYGELIKVTATITI
jgi:hypothetical protein|nr:MAG TPA: hypothetical protein [Caudoviricetes sp.]